MQNSFSQRVRHTSQSSTTPSPAYEADVLGRSFITLDGNLLAASWKGGSYIPDRMVEKEQLMNELREEVCRIIRQSTKVKDYGTLFQILRHRRGSSDVVRRENPKPKTDKWRLQRRSWGPDDTWSSMFASDVERGKKTPANDRHSYHFTEAERLKDRQPVNGYSLRGNNRKKLESTSNLDSSNDSCNSDNYDARRRELMKMIAWTCDVGSDYVHTETIQNIFEAEMILDIMLASRTPLLLTFRVNTPTDIHITYQFLHTFKQDYMILKISKTHCMLMRAF